ncbi:Tannase/feruloyl esterase [Fusarium solani]|uniref:Carboxylic ester hydrolase n=1 Tax=Fusarium solani TaxID=169388 RepID=A0A9P9KEP7_FUSSL|nr:Tannase/feruloyl esterase [Fusarium solani]KAH7254520.1 Tannase/feruloyl esterase [Fusarium solani]
MKPFILLTTFSFHCGLAASVNASLKSCSNLKLEAFPDFKILHVETSERQNYTSPGSQLTVDICNLSLSLQHHGADDVVRVGIWFPLQDWNGRFMATGGSGISAGDEINLVIPAAQGYAAGFTDAGLTLKNTIDSQTTKWFLRADGTVNEVLLENFAHRSMHDLAVIGKAAVKEFYGKQPAYSYYSGCSQGGRQGYCAAEKHPKDFDGILANAPAINAPQLSPAEFWPSVLMTNIVVPPQCVFRAYQDAIVEACDALDGARDGLISAPERCHYDTSRLVSKKIECTETGSTVIITKKHAELTLWYGTPPGANFDGLANTTTVNDSTVPVPFVTAEAWFKYAIAQDPSLDTSKLSLSDFFHLFKQSVDQLTDSLGSENPDLTGFKNAGGKLLSWHGMADPLIMHGGTVLYWNKLRQKASSQGELDSFYRLFLAPGAGHCFGGVGPNPTEPLSALVDWVERGISPETLFTETTMSGKSVSRNLCPYPSTLRYDGKGDVNSAKSFTCSQ